MGDQVQCFYCDGGLKNWDPGDRPWVEHARWFGNCPFLQLKMGKEFILWVKAKTGAVTDRELDQWLKTDGSRYSWLSVIFRFLSNAEFYIVKKLRLLFQGK